MDPAKDGAYVAEAVHCHACAASDAEKRSVERDRHSNRFGDGSFDGLYIVTKEL